MSNFSCNLFAGRDQGLKRNPLTQLMESARLHRLVLLLNQPDALTHEGACLPLGQRTWHCPLAHGCLEISDNALAPLGGKGRRLSTAIRFQLF